MEFPKIVKAWDFKAGNKRNLMVMVGVIANERVATNSKQVIRETIKHLTAWLIFEWDFEWKSDQ